jgi:hypothetical protein
MSSRANRLRADPGVGVGLTINRSDSQYCAIDQQISRGMVSVDAILALNIMPAKDLEHFFLRVCPAGGTNQQFAVQ